MRFHKFRSQKESFFLVFCYVTLDALNYTKVFFKMYSGGSLGLSLKNMIDLATVMLMLS